MPTHSILLLTAAAVACATVGTAAGADDHAPPVSRFEIKSLPGWVAEDGTTPAPLPSKMYTGYIPAGTPPSGKGTMYFHYWAVMAEQNPETAPTVIWYNGGPGASSLFGLLQEWGPLRLTEASYDERYNATGVPTPKFNPFRWTKTMTMIAIDSPPPMGLSFCSEEGPSGGPTSCGPWTDKSVFAANHAAHRALLTDIFPELKGNPLYFTGESYAGIYVPGFARAIMDDPIPGVPFKGFAVGDGWTGCKPMPGRPVNWCINLDNVGVFKYPNVEPGPYYDIEFFHGHSQFSNSLYRSIMSTCSDDELRGVVALGTSCAPLIDQMSEEIGGWFPYNLYNACPTGTMASRAQQSTPSADKHGMNRALRSRRAMFASFARMRGAGHSVTHDSGLSSPCLGQAMTEWFLLNETLRAIGAPLNSAFINLDNGHGFNYTSNEPFIGDVYLRAQEMGLRTWVYEGDVDACGLQTSNVEDIFTELFENQTMTQRWHPWTTDGAQEMGGYSIEWNKGSARFISIRGSGHLVPLNRPHVSEVMINAFVNGQDLPAFVPTKEL